MFRAVIVEDEQPILDLMKVLIGRNPDYAIIGAFTSPLEALASLPELKPDVIFIDVEMPKMNGLELAGRVHKLMESTEIVFTTAYKNYALEAFEVSALDYILKPVTMGAIKRVTERLLKRLGTAVPHEQKAAGPTICCFGGFDVRNSAGQPVHFRTRRAEELFAYFLCHPGRYISKWKLTDLLWPDMQDERGSSNLHNTLYLLKKVLKENDFGMSIQKVNDGYVLEAGSKEYDVLIFQRLQNLSAEGRIEADQAEQLISLYRGPLFEGKPYLWKISLEEAYFKQYTALIRWLVARDLASRNSSKAEERLDAYLAHYPLQEDMLQLLFDIYSKHGKKEKIIRLYENFEAAYRKELGLEPSGELKNRVAAYLG
ncbi:response regulator [Paenibacillus sp. BAC0078]